MDGNCAIDRCDDSVRLALRNVECVGTLLRCLSLIYSQPPFPLFLHDLSGTAVTDGWRAAMWMLELNLGRPQEQLVLITAEPSLQPFVKGF